MLSLLPVLLALAAPPKMDLPPTVETYLKAQTDLLEKRPLGGAKTLKEWQAKRPTLHRQYLDMLGLWPLPKKTPLKAKITGTVDRGAVVIDKVHFQSKPGLYVTGNLYRPAKNKKKLPAILYLCGHSGRGRDGNKTAFQDHGMWFARNGYVCLVIDTLQLGEIAGKHHGTYNLGRFWWHSRGYTPAGVECWNGIRAIDYLCSRDDVDKDRIGVTGISGGGAATVWITAADDRVKVSVPVSGMSDLSSYVKDQVINGHCDCMFLYNNYRWDWATIAALIAPRPMLFANSDNDPIFPMDGNRRIIARLRTLYKLHDKPNLVDDYVSKGGHDYRKDLRLAIFKWFNKHLKNDTSEIKDADDKPLPGKDLRAFAEDADIPRDAINGSADESFVPVAQVTLPEKGKFAVWKKELLGQLRDRVFAALDDGVPEASKTTATKSRIEWKGGGAVKLSAAINPQAAGDGLLVVLGDKDEETHKVPAWLAAEAGKKTVHLLVPRGTLSLAWERKTPNTIERSHALLGTTVDLMRVMDIIAVVRHLKTKDKKRDWVVAGRGNAGIIAAYAALFEPSIKGVIVGDPPSSHREGPHLLGVQKILDIPEALGMLAPLPLTLVDAPAKLVARASAIYAIAGGKVTTKTTRRPRIDPAGVAGLLILCGHGKEPVAALERFLEHAGGKKAAIHVLSTKGGAKNAEAFAKMLRSGIGEVKPARVKVLRLDGKLAADALDKATGVWLTDGTMTQARTALATIKRRPVGASADAVRAVSFLLPDSLIEVLAPNTSTTLPTRLKNKPGLVGYEIPPRMALVVGGGRLMRALGDGAVTVHLAASTNRKARTLELTSKKVADLVTLQRSARDRADNYPPKKVGVPVVEKGTLVIIGGNGMPNGMIARFVELAGGKKARIVVLPTANPDPLPNRDGIAAAFKKMGAAKVTILKGRTLADVESKESLAAFKDATGIWFGGGRQWRFVDAYEGTKALPLMFDVLKRGGVIGGSSAGATIQGDYLCRGGFFDNFEIASEGYERGLNFLPGTAIDQHFAQRKRFKDMTALMKLYPQYLGIGLDEATAIIVKGSTAEVVGRGEVHFYDGTKPVEKGKPDHVSLKAGAKYDLKGRKVIE